MSKSTDTPPHTEAREVLYIGFRGGRVITTREKLVQAFHQKQPKGTKASFIPMRSKFGTYWEFKIHKGIVLGWIWENDQHLLDKAPSLNFWISKFGELAMAQMQATLRGEKVLDDAKIPFSLVVAPGTAPKGWTITYNPKTGEGVGDLDFVHESYNPAPEAYDPRCGTATSLAAAVSQINAIEESRKEHNWP